MVLGLLFLRYNGIGIFDCKVSTSWIESEDKMNETHSPAGNVYNKFDSRNIIVRWMMKGFLNSFDSLITQTDCLIHLEVGSGEGRMAEHFTKRFPNRKLVHSDISHEVVAGACKIIPAPLPVVASADMLPFEDDAFDCVIACEVLEHLTEPDKAVSEIARVTKSFALFSVPREPLWRFMNICRGAYVRDWGNTPGHIQHFNLHSFHALIKDAFDIVETKEPIPWLMVLGKKKKKVNEET